MRVGIFARKSTDAQATSVDRQIEDARAFAAMRGWEVDEGCIFAVDEGVSGVRRDAPQLLALKAEGRRRPPRIDGVILQAPDRLSRDMVELQIIVRDLAESGLQVWCYATGRAMATNSAQASLLVALDGFASAMERERIVARTREAMQYRARRGFVTGNALYGYRNVRVQSEGRTFVDREILEDEAQWVRLMFSRYADGKGPKAVAGELNALGVPSPKHGRRRGARWGADTVKGMLANPSYYGKVRFGVKVNDRSSGKRRVHTNDPSEQTWSDAPQRRILSEELEARVEARRRARSPKTGRCAGREARGAIVGNVLCGECGGKIYVVGRNHCYRCHTRNQSGARVCSNGATRPVREVDEVVLGAVADTLAPDAIVEAVMRRLAEASSGRTLRETRVEALSQRVASLEREIENLTSAILVASSAEAVGRLTQLLDARSKSLRESRIERDSLRSEVAAETVDTGTLRERAERLVAEWRTRMAGDVPTARAALSDLLDGPARAVLVKVNDQNRWLIRGSLRVPDLTKVGIRPLGSPSF